MQIPSRFTIAVHILTLIAQNKGSGGATLAKAPEEINLLQVFRAVDSIGPSGKLFSFHDNPNPACPVGRNIHGILDQSLEDIQMAMEKELEKKTLAGILKDAKANWKEAGA